MGRPESPLDPDEGPIAAFAAQLRRLRDSVGKPDYRLLSDYAHFAHVTLAEAARGQRLPTWQVTEAFVLGCIKYFHEISERSFNKCDPGPRREELKLRTWRTRWEHAKTMSGGEQGSSRSPPKTAPTVISASAGLSELHLGDSPRSHRTAPPSVLIVDDHDLVGTSVAYSLNADGLAARHAGAVDVAGVLAEADALPAGLALLDLDLGRDRTGRRFDGVDLVEPLCARGWRCIVLSGAADASRIGAALAAGALAAVPKQAPLPVLLSKVRAALSDLPVMAPELRRRLIESYLEREAERHEIDKKLERLTRREREVLAELARGHRSQAVADQYVVSLATVRSQIRSVLTKLEVGSQLEAVALYRHAQSGEGGRK